MKQHLRNIYNNISLIIRLKNYVNANHSSDCNSKLGILERVLYCQNDNQLKFSTCEGHEPTEIFAVGKLIELI